MRKLYLEADDKLYRSLGDTAPTSDCVLDVFDD